MGTTFQDLLIALGLGLLVGLQKERAESPLAGLRTFALVSVFGAVTALIAPEEPWLIAAGLLTITALMVTGNIIQLKTGEPTPGQTTEVALVLMYLIGALTVAAPTELGVVLGAALAVLLHLREELKGIVRKLSDRDVRAIMQFVVVSLIVLPVLPNRAYGPFEVLNPHNIWWMVVLIVGLNLAGYGAFRLFGAKAGTVMAGALGGVISSTATTMSYARTTKGHQDRVRAAAVIIWIASGVVFARILIEIGVVSPSFLRVAAPPMLIMLATFALITAATWRSVTKPTDSPLEPTNPSELQPAILFGAMYAVVLFIVAAAENYLGDAGLFAVAALSGLTDIDAITLSTSQMVATDRLDPDTGWRLVLLASLSNLVFKLGIAATVGGRALFMRLGRWFGVAFAVGAGLIVFWG